MPKEEEGGWHILRDWNSVDFDPKHVLQQLQVKYGASPFFKISVVPNPSSPGNSSISVSPSGLGLPNRNYYYGKENDPIQLAYVQLIRDVVIMLSATKTEGERFGKNMYNYEKRIAEVTPDPFELENPVNTYHPIKLSELSLTAPSLPLHDTLTAMFPEANIEGETEILITSPDYLSKVSQIVATTDRAVMNGYIMWTLVREYIPYLSTKFTSSVDLFQKELLGIEEPLQRWEFCTNLVQKFMGLAVEILLEKRYPITKNEKKYVIDVFDSIKKTVKKRLSKYSTVRDLEQHLNKKINSLKLQIGLPNEVMAENYQRNYYTKLNVFKANLFESYKNGIVFLKKIEERRLVQPHNHDYIVNNIVLHPYSIHYEPSTNAVIVPRAVLTSPNFEENYPKSIIYGRLGIEIAHAILSSVLPYNSAWTADSKLLTSFHMVVNESINSIRYPRNCLQKAIINNDLLSSEATANLTTMSTYKSLAALSVVRQTLMNNLNTENHMHQPSLEKYEDDAIFFISFAQTHCSVQTPQQEQYEYRNNFILPQRSILYISWWQIPEFKTAFKCISSNDSHCKGLF